MRLCVFLRVSSAPSHLWVLCAEGVSCVQRGWTANILDFARTGEPTRAAITVARARAFRRLTARCRYRRTGPPRAVTAGAVSPVSVLRACGFGERNRVTGAVVSIWFSVSHRQCVTSVAATAVAVAVRSNRGKYEFSRLTKT